MKTKTEIVENWLPRYMGVPLKEFGQYILLTNFVNYVTTFAEQFDCEIRGLDKPMQTATANNITIVNFGMGSAMAATGATPARRHSSTPASVWPRRARTPPGTARRGNT